MTRKVVLVVVFFLLATSIVFSEVCFARVQRASAGKVQAFIDYGSGDIDKKIFNGVCDFINSMEAGGWKLEQFEILSGPNYYFIFRK